jgi:membrane-bound serine protease (ClpP class)
MTRPPRAWRSIATLVLVAIGLAQESPSWAQENEGKPGRFFTVDQPITSNAIEDLQSASLAFVKGEAAKGQLPYVFFEVRPGSSSYGTAYDLATFISTQLTGARERVAYVPEPLSGYGVLAVLACGEIVLGPEASLGPIAVEGRKADRAQREFIRVLANRTGREDLVDLMLGMLDPDADLRRVQTNDGRWHYAMPERMPQLQQLGIVRSEPAWEAGRRGVLTADRGRGELVHLIAKDRAEVGRTYNVRGLSDDPTLGRKLNPVWIRIDGVLDTVKVSFLRRRIAQAKDEGVNLLFFQFDTKGGQFGAADDMADFISRLKDIKTVAYIDDQALGVATLPALACDEIVFAKGAQMGQGNEIIAGWSGPRSEPLESKLVGPAARRAADLAKLKGHPDALAYVMFEPDSVLLEAKDARTGAPVLVLEEAAKVEPQRYLDPVVRKRAGKALLLNADDPMTIRLVRAVVPDIGEFQALYGLRGQNIRAEGANWVDAVVTTLNMPWMKGTLLFIGLFMLVLELKLPGIGLPAIISALAFLLFFWSSYLSGTADQLEIMLFLVGLICLALELFVFPGFGVFGASGILLVLVSIVMASHTFVWPTSEYEYRQLGRTLLQVALSLFGVGTAVVLVGRYLPSIPFLNRMVLQPETEDLIDPTAKPVLDEVSYLFLMGETGRTATVLRPSGKAKFGDLLLDVTSDGDYIEPDRLVEVVDVQGNRIVVKRV